MEESTRREQLNRTKEILQATKKLAKELLRTFDLHDTTLQQTKRTIRIVVFVFTILAVKDLLTHYQLISYCILHLSDEIAIPLSVVVIFLPISTFLFWRQKRIGWIMFVIYLSFVATLNLWEIFQGYNINRIPLFARDAGPLPTIMNLIFFAGTICALCTSSLLKLFRIKKETALQTIFFTVLLTGLYLALTSGSLNA